LFGEENEKNGYRIFHQIRPLLYRGQTPNPMQQHDFRSTYPKL
jgi:hypothetical protein